MNYFLKRILLFIPTLFVISLIIFSISSTSPEETLFAQDENLGKGTNTDFVSLEKRLSSLRNSLGINKPFFYLSVQRHSLSDTLCNIHIEDIKKSISSWSFSIASWKSTHEVYQKIKTEIRTNQDPIIREKLTELLYNSDWMEVCSKLKQLGFDHFIPTQTGNPVNNYLPTVQWHGSDNQYHHWISSIIRLDLGRSLISKENISSVLQRAIGWTLGLSLSSLLLSILIAIPLAVSASRNIGGKLDRFCSNLFFSFYSLPTFWIASLLLIYFASTENLQWFPSFGVGEINENMSWFEILNIRISHLALPLICWTYGSIAFIYRQMRSKLIENMSKDYVLTAKAKGLSMEKISWKHVFKNSSFPLITILGASLPALIGGSFVIESIFSIPGMGKLTLDAFLQRDYPLIHSISLIACFLTILGIFLADLAYHYADPRIKYAKDNVQ